MQTVERKFSPEIRSKVLAARDSVKRQFQIEGDNNIILTCEKIQEGRHLEGDIVECGVFKGTTIFPIAQFCMEQNVEKHIVGFDTFGGFPEGQTHAYDLPQYFKTLLEKEVITNEHYEKARERTRGFTDHSHLTINYFQDIENVFKVALSYPNIELIKGIFAKTLPMYTNRIAVLFLDCDLYQSYKDCLETLYEQVTSGGAIIFDEYYSLKYPGARVAVNEFFDDKTGCFEMYRTDEGFERWCFIKK